MNPHRGDDDSDDKKTSMEVTTETLKPKDEPDGFTLGTEGLTIEIEVDEKKLLKRLWKLVRQVIARLFKR